MLKLSCRVNRRAAVLIVLVALLATRVDAAPHRAGRRMRATAYCQRGRTSTGTLPERGTIAADPRVLPRGSRVRLTSRMPEYSGTYLVTDTGAAVKGNTVDIYMPDCAEARRFGRHWVFVSEIRPPLRDEVATK